MIRPTFPVVIAILLISLVLVTANAFGKDIYSGSVSYVKFNDDGSFVFQLTNQGNLVEYQSNCKFKNMFLAKKIRKLVDYEKLNRMRKDIRDIFLAPRNNLTLSVFVEYCDDETGLPIISNLMLGKQSNSIVN